MEMFPKDQDCVSHTVRIIDKDSRYTGRPLFHVCNHKFYRVVEVVWNKVTFWRDIQRAKKIAGRESFYSSFSSRYS